MTWIKICGTTNLEDALTAVDAGADAVGFVFYEKSPRYVSIETVREIVARLPESVEKVGVFVGGRSEDISKTLKTTGLTAAQVYPDGENPMLEDEILRSTRLIVAAPEQAFVNSTTDEDPRGFFLSTGLRKRMMAMLVDSGNSERPGGTGKKFDWENASWIRNGMSKIGVKFIVAGGLTPSNVIEAINILKPWGVDVASGVEARPGKKDPEKVRAFIGAVRESDRKAS